MEPFNLRSVYPSARLNIMPFSNTFKIDASKYCYVLLIWENEEEIDLDNMYLDTQQEKSMILDRQWQPIKRRRLSSRH